MENLICSIDRGEPHLVDGSEGRKAVEIILAIYQSNQEGQAVNLPL